ncbi:MAG: hypothetical protein KDA57_14205 [Planctomycetales bacterium]|nr:hypothetical protein [Planctomycetales bacterium]
MNRLSCASVLLVVGAIVAPVCASPASNVRSIDGVGNNLAQPDWGAADMPMQRVAETPFSTGAHYPGDGSGATFYGGPGSGTTAANPRVISNRLYDDQGHSPVNDRRMSHMVWQWGQFLDHDITLAETSSLPSEYAPIHIYPGDPMTPSIPLQRTQYASGTGTSGSNPRQQVNSITSYIDASNVYGSDAVRAAALRDIGNGGRLKTSAGDLLPFNTMGLPNAGSTSPTMFLGGDVRANEQVGLTAMHTLFVREHNRLADLLATNNPTWSDEELYQTSRKIVGAEMQAITYREFLPALLGKGYARSLSPYAYAYDDSIDATIGNEFATSIYRFGHSMLPEVLPLARVGSSPAEGLPLANAYFDPTFLGSDTTSGTNHLEQILLGLSVNKAQEIDTKMTDAVRDFLFGSPGAGGMDLAALNIQRGRDHGLPLYNEMRIAYGLAPATSFRDITSDRDVRRKLRDLYGSVDKIDSWVGVLAEDHVYGSSVGELSLTAIVEEFTKLRDGDRFFYTGDSELMDNPAIDAVIDLETISLSDIMQWNTDLVHVPRNVFRVDRWGFDFLFERWDDFWPDWDDHFHRDDFFGGFGNGSFFPNDLLTCMGPHFHSIPEPSTWLIGLSAGLGLCLRRRTRSA